MNVEFMNRAIELAKESASYDEVPVGAVVVKDGTIIAEGVNRKERDNCAISHAEILALQKATEVVGNWWLEDCDLYVTLEPCAMCAMAMVHSRIRHLYFGAYATMKKMADFYNGYYKRFNYDTFNKLTEAFGLDPTKRINGFSKGMQRQAEMVLALSTHPKLLLLDESFDGIDPQKRIFMKGLLKEAIKENKFRKYLKKIMLIIFILVPIKQK